jgi:tetratricopeptide (TPR) repeat protein
LAKSKIERYSTRKLDKTMKDDQPPNSQPEKPMKFRSTLPTFPEGRPVTGAEYEAFIKERIEVSGGTDLNALYQLSGIYSRTGRLEQAEKCILLLMELNKTPGGMAAHLLQLGQIAERVDDYEIAASHYRRGLEAGPVETQIRYFLRNNLGYSLNRLRRHAEAEPLLREAIEIDPEQPNAYKNLGLCMWGLKRPTEAALCFINATRVNAADARALRHLEKLYELRPEVADTIPDFDALLGACRAAVAETARHWPDLQAWWRKTREETAGSPPQGVDRPD